MRTMSFLGANGTKIVWQEGKIETNEPMVLKTFEVHTKLADLQGGIQIDMFDFVPSNYLAHDVVARMWIHSYFEGEKEEIVEEHYSPDYSHSSWTKYKDAPKGYVI